MRVAAYQAPHLPFGSFDAVGLIAGQLDSCVEQGIDILCCPESVLGGLAHESDGQSPADVALGVADGSLAAVVAPLLAHDLTLIVGFTERDPAGTLFSSAAVLQDGAVAGVARKAYPGYRTVIQGGDQITVFRHLNASFGIVICNDIWYVEPVRLAAVAGAAIVFVPSNSGHLRGPSPSMRARGENLPIARAVENTTTVVVADVAGRQGGRIALGSSAIVDPDGTVVARADAEHVGLVTAEVDAQRRPFDPRGWDGWTNERVAESFTALWRPA